LGNAVARRLTLIFLLRSFTVQHLLIAGCGDIGRRIARLALAEQVPTAALVRSAELARQLQQQGLTVHLGDLDGIRPVQGLPFAGSTILYLVPPPGGGHIDPRVRVFCGSIEPGEEPQKIVYLSTSGVYGDCGGAVVSEETPTNPQTARARRRLDAEEILRAWTRHRGIPLVILRVTGIYGPGRLPLQRLQQKHPVLREEEAAYTNRIHADDLARVCWAAAQQGEDGDIFNVSDGQPGTMTEYFNAVADAAGLPRPPQVTMTEARQVMTPMMLSYLQESRRMDNRRMLEKLDMQLQYPDLATGIRASLAGEWLGTEKHR
jgi:uncharacterized protein YbjT (DUF2867 family)